MTQRKLVLAPEYGGDGGTSVGPCAERRDGEATGDYEVFADGFAGQFKDPTSAAHRPSGLAVGPAGELNVSDDSRGRIWRVAYVGPGTTTASVP